MANATTTNKATVKVASLLLNSVTFQKYLEKTDKHGRKYKEMMNQGGISIEGRNPYKLRTGLAAPVVYTELAAKDWEYIQEKYGHTSEIAGGFIFAGKTDNETMLYGENEGKNLDKFGNEPVQSKAVAK